MESLSASTGSFTLDLYKKLNETSKDKNIFFFPWSIATPLAMVYLGTKGDTATQMAEVSSEISTEGIHSGFKELLATISKPRNNYLLKSHTLSNSIFQKFVQLFKRYYKAKPPVVNFKTDVEQARKQINSWAENETERKIQDLLPTGSLDSHTVLVSVNDIYFKGNWEKKFLEENTSERPFRLSKSHVLKKAILFILEKTMNCYEGSGLSLTTTFKDEALRILELTYEKLAEWTRPANMIKAAVELYLPKLKPEENYDLKSSFSGCFHRDIREEDLFISSAIHKAFVEVSEEGTEAAAATGVLVTRTSAMTATFKADHPFLFSIRHNKFQTIFFGRLCSPLAELLPALQSRRCLLAAETNTKS
uniref:Serpin B10 n=1 Tax=Apteryx owenii TaxID=8824 RepID=A0A8B9SAW7_APTOW